MPVVSVLIPAFNAAAFISDTLASAQRQTLSDIEIIVVDDASTDATVSLVEAVAASDARLRLLRRTRNGGPSAARNAGIAMARGDWIAPLDSDDLYEPERLQNLVTLAIRHGVELCSDNVLLVPRQDPANARPMIPQSVLAGDRELGLHEYVHRNVVDPALPDTNYGSLQPIMRREFLSAHAIRYDEMIRFAEDFTLMVDCFRKGARWWISSAPTYRYLVRTGSLRQVQTTHDLGRLRQLQCAMLADARKEKDHELERLVRRHQRVVDRCYYYRASTDAVKSGEPGTALGYIFESPRSALLVTEESLRQLPVILRKALSGGYGRKRPWNQHGKPTKTQRGHS